MNGGSLPMHEAIGADDIASVNLTDALMAEADSEDGDDSAHFFNHLAADPRVVRSAGARRYTDTLGCFLANFIERDLVVAMHLHLRAQFSEVLDEVVGERIVVVDDKQHGRESTGRT